MSLKKVHFQGNALRRQIRSILAPCLCASVAILVMAIIATTPPLLSQEDDDELAKRAAAAQEVAVMLSNITDNPTFLSLNDVYMGEALDRLQSIVGRKIGWNASKEAAADAIYVELDGEPVEVAFQKIFYPRNCIHVAEYKMNITFFRIIDDPLTPLRKKALDPEKNKKLMTDLAELFHKAMEAWTKEDVEAFAALCAEEVTFSDTTSPVDPEELKKNLTEIFDEEVFSEFSPGQLLHTERMVAIQIGNLPDDFHAFTIAKESFKSDDIVLAAPMKVLTIIDETIGGDAKFFIVRKVEGHWRIVGL